MIKLTELIKKDCNCGSSCCSVKESVEDKNKEKKKFQSRMKHEGGFRDKMFKLEQWKNILDKGPENRDI